MKTPPLTDDQKELATECARMMTQFNERLAAMSSGIEVIAESLQRLANGEVLDLEAEYHRLDASSKAMKGFDAGTLRVGMEAAARFFEQLIKGDREK